MHRYGFVAIVALVVAACAGPASPTSIPTANAPTRVEITLTDALRIDPPEVTVRAGVPVKFVVTNSGATDHEFYLGDEEAQAAHEAEMQQMGGMTHDELGGIAVEPGETKELTFTFSTAGQTLAGCHVAGHYAGGMRASITIE